MNDRTYHYATMHPPPFELFVDSASTGTSKSNSGRRETVHPPPFEDFVLSASTGASSGRGTSAAGAMRERMVVKASIAVVFEEWVARRVG